MGLHKWEKEDAHGGVEQNYAEIMNGDGNSYLLNYQTQSRIKLKLSHFNSLEVEKILSCGNIPNMVNSPLIQPIN